MGPMAIVVKVNKLGIRDERRSVYMAMTRTISKKTTIANSITDPPLSSQLRSLDIGVDPSILTPHRPSRFEETGWQALPAGSRMLGLASSWRNNHVRCTGVCCSDVGAQQCRGRNHAKSDERQ